MALNTKWSKASTTDEEETANGESKPVVYDKPTDPNSAGYQEFVRRGGAAYGDSTSVNTSTPLTRSNILGLGDDTRVQSSGGIDTSLLPRTTTASTSQTSKTTYSGKAPGAAPVFKAPEEWTASQRAGEVQSQAALGLKQNRQALREAIAGLGNDPASRLALRDALNAHGINIERTLLGAKTAAQQEEARDVNQKLAVAQAEYTSAANAFEAEWRKYLSTATTSTTGTNTTTSTIGEAETSNPTRSFTASRPAGSGGNASPSYASSSAPLVTNSDIAGNAVPVTTDKATRTFNVRR